MLNFNTLLDFLFPHTCLLCRGKSDRNIDLCTDCENDLPFIKYRCHVCGIPLENDSKICGACLKNPPPFDCTFSLFHYENPITKLITNLKFNGNLMNAKMLGYLMAMHLEKQLLQSNSIPDLIIPVPLHKKRLQERGFNQALEIARPISKHLKIPIDIKNCKRIKSTKAQALMHAKERRKNIKNAFLINKNFHPTHIAIVDDVVTTGNTVSELSAALKSAGVHYIEIWCCART